VESLPFEATLALPPPDAPSGAAPAGPGYPQWMQSLLKQAPLAVWLGAAGALLAVLLVGLLVLGRKMFRRKAAGASPVAAVHAAPGHAQLPPAEHGPDFEARAMAMLAENDAARERLESETLASLRTPAQTKKGEVLKKVILEQAKKEPAAVAQLIRTWLTEKEH
jgi:flagellar biosynthesis/type III secretory pathway M-ring protein FliF/YscJ